MVLEQSVSDERVLCINSGSSTLKFAVVAIGGGHERKLTDGAIEDIGGDHTAALESVLERLGGGGARDVTIAGHRVVHGGPAHVAPAFVDDALLASLRAIVALAPLHMPAAIAGIEAVRKKFPELPQVVCFDTAFHASMPEVARRLPIPDRFAEAGVRRYGFHGLSYEYVMSVLGDARPDKIVIAHLGNGASLVAVSEGRAIDTTMGLTPTGGILMGTRSGDVDPGVLIHLARQGGFSVDALERLVNQESGLLALGGTSDMQTLQRRASTDPRAQRAIAAFGYSVRKATGALIAALGGIDLLVFTGGIGEHVPEVRAEACRGLEAFGLALDPARNAHGDEVVSSAASRCLVRVIATNEDVVIARHAHRLNALRR